MKKFLLGTVALIAFAAPAAAADLAARPYTKAPPIIAAIYDWSGFYIGANGGWGSSHNCWSQVPGGLLLGSDGCHDATGGVAGGQIGYRWQSGAWVFGLEAQGDWADLKGSNNSAIFPGLFTNQTKIDAFGLFTGQVGYAVNNVLLYAKGGAALTDNRYRTFFTPTGVLAGSASDTRWGGTIGAGIMMASSSYAPIVAGSVVGVALLGYLASHGIPRAAAAMPTITMVITSSTRVMPAWRFSAPCRCRQSR